LEARFAATVPIQAGSHHQRAFERCGGSAWISRRFPEFHPRVVKVDLLSGKTLRELGASYQCHLSGGKHTRIEKNIEIIPLLNPAWLHPQRVKMAILQQEAGLNSESL
jgi:hypothetical protein